MTPEVERLCEELDAAIFSGDTFYSQENIDALVNYMERWKRELKKFEEIIEKP